MSSASSSPDANFSSKEIEGNIDRLSSSSLSSTSHKVCNMLIPQLLEHRLLKDYQCIMCNHSIHLHSQTSHQQPSVNLSSSASSKSSLDKAVISDLPQWKKDYKVCNTFFNTLEQLFVIHNVNDESLYKRYLHLTLNELHDSDRTYTFNHIINTEHSWEQIKSLFAQRFETYDHVNR